MFLVFLSQMNKKNLRRSYQMNMNHYLYPKDYDSSTNTFSFNMHIFDQQIHFHSIGTFSVKKRLLFNRLIFGQQAYFCISNLNGYNLSISVFWYIYYNMSCVYLYIQHEPGIDPYGAQGGPAAQAPLWVQNFFFSHSISHFCSQPPFSPTSLVNLTQITAI